MQLCIDIDNVVADTDTVMRAIIRKHTTGRVDLRYENICRFEYELCRDDRGQAIDSDTWETVHNDLFSIPEVVIGIRPIATAQHAIGILVASGFEIEFVTSRQPKVHDATAAWLKTHFGHVSYSLRFATHRQKHLNSSYFASIEDDLEQALLFVGLTQDLSCPDELQQIKASQPKVEHSFILAHPWNEHVELTSVAGHGRLTDCISRHADWRSISRTLADLHLAHRQSI